MDIISKSALLRYILDSANDLLGNNKDKRLTANQFVIVLLILADKKANNILPNELRGESIQSELNAAISTLNRYQCVNVNTLKRLITAVADDKYYPYLDEIQFMNMVVISASDLAMSQGKTEIGADTLLDVVLSEPTNIIKQYIINAAQQGATKVISNGSECTIHIELNELVKGIYENDSTEDDSITDENTGSDNDDSANKDKKKEISNLVKNVKRAQDMLLRTVFGQDHAVTTLISGYFQAELMSITNKTGVKPRSTFLFAGPPGVGKTFLAETTAKVLNLPFKRFDMSEYSDKEANLEFCGSDKVYKDAKSGNVTSFVNDNPKCIILFDEIEKAHINVIHLFLQILDAGRLRDNFTDVEVPFSDTIIIFTTNAGKNLYRDSSYSNLSGLPKKTILKALETDMNASTGMPFFPAAICSRFASGNVIMFNYITADNLTKIVRNEMSSNAKYIKESSGIKSLIDEKVYTSMLFAEGGSADARTVKSRAKDFFHTELFELLRLIDSDKTSSSISQLQNVHFSVDLLTCDENIESLFINKDKPQILLFSSKSVYDICSEKMHDDVQLFWSDDIEKAKAILWKQDIQLVLCDLECGVKSENTKLLNLEDVDSNGRDFFWYVRMNLENTPLYLIQKEPKSINFEEQLSFTREGARGFITLTKSNIEFHNTIIRICDALHRQDSMAYLSRANKVVCFETSQSISADGKTAEIKLFDFELVLAVDADDTRCILSNISKPDVRFDQIIGAKDAKEELSYFVDYLRSPKKYFAQGVKAPKGVLLYGPPGTGKTMLAKAMAAESDVTFITAEGNQFLKKYVGDGPEMVHNLFNTARKYAPSILFVDEIDAIAKERGTSESINSADNVLNAFLAEMDGFKTDSTRPVFVLAATNFSADTGSARSLDAALLRRFDRRIYVDLPNREEREVFLRIKIAKNTAIDISDEKIANIAVRSTGMSLASLESIIELARRIVIRTDGFKVTDDVLEEAFETFNSGEEKKWDSKTLERIARHEAGHAFISWVNGDAPSYVTIVARSSHGGYVQHSNDESKGIYTKDELYARIRTALAGRATEVVYYGEDDGTSTGASGDLQTATRIAQNIVCSYGMDKDFGMAVINVTQISDYTTTSDIRKHINEILNMEYEKAKNLIQKNRHIIDQLVNELLVKNHLAGVEIKNFFENKDYNV